MATRTATADGGAIVGRNVDWSDHYGLYRPTLVIYRPNNGDLSWISACWPLSGAAAVGMNEAGLAFSFNFFTGADDLIGMRLPQWPHRRVLQKARSVEEATKILTGARQRFIGGFFSLADAAGNIGLVECTAGECAVYRTEGDWFAQANNALTEQMTAHQELPPGGLLHSARRNGGRRAAASGKDHASDRITDSALPSEHSLCE